MADDRAVEAAAEALHRPSCPRPEACPCGASMPLGPAEKAIAAARPVIEEPWRKRVAELGALAESEGARRIAAERQRQIEAEGYTPEHDAQHDDRSLLGAAQCYAGIVGGPDGVLELAFNPRYPGLVGWPWEPEAWKPSDDPIRNLEKAGALIAAEIDRLLAGGES